MHLYLHIPFCKQACHYCDFHFSTSLKQKSEIIKAIEREIEMQKDFLSDRKINSIYFGGGTPSLLSKEELNSLFNTIASYFNISKNAEITLEANPDDINLEKLNAWLSAGINRLSIGIQSFDEKQLRFLNRSHDDAAASMCIDLALKAGFENFSIDLIYGIPAESHQIWKDNLAKIFQYNITHISAYCLTIEDKTVFGRQLKKKVLKPIDEEFAAQQFEILLEETKKNGFEQYEISNFAQNGHYAKHNSSYWFGEPYLGVGPSAHSFNGTKRQWNISNNSVYLKSIRDKNEIPFESEVLSTTNQANELIMTSLRTKWGLNTEKLSALKMDLSEFNARIKDFESQGFLDKTGSILHLTTKGKLQADYIASELFF